MSKTAFLFPGQGSQSVGMMSDLASGSELVRSTFQEASAVLGYDLWEVTEQGPEERLGQTQVTQPALLAAGIATWRAWCDRGGSAPDFMAGHSLGEYTALVAAGALIAYGFVGVISVWINGKVLGVMLPPQWAMSSFGLPLTIGTPYPHPILHSSGTATLFIQSERPVQVRLTVHDLAGRERDAREAFTEASKQLKAKLYEIELRERQAAAASVEEGKADVGWGSQIRNYVLDQSRIKDLRTGVETGNTQAVLDGGLDSFIEASLKQGL